MIKPFIKKQLNLLSKIYKVIYGYECYDPLKFSLFDSKLYSLYDSINQFVVPIGQGIYDPEVFGLYDIKSQTVLKKIDSSLLETNLNYDDLMRESQRYCRKAPFSLCSYRYTLALQHLIPGEGILLDACTTSPQEKTKLAVQQLGYRYMAIDINGDDDTVKKEDLTRLSFSDSSIDAIISLDTLEHIDNYCQALSELYRILKENGLIIIHVPSYYFGREDSQQIPKEKDPWGHVRYFSAVELVKNVKEAGFIILRVAYQFDYGAVICVGVKNNSITADR